MLLGTVVNIKKIPVIIKTMVTTLEIAPLFHILSNGHRLCISVRHQPIEIVKDTSTWFDVTSQL